MFVCIFCVKINCNAREFGEFLSHGGKISDFKLLRKVYVEIHDLPLSGCVIFSDRCKHFELFLESGQ